jgi:hypothetical protein
MNDKQQYPMSPRAIVENNIRFRVPLYQRPYAWKRKNVEVLLKDLWNAFENKSEYHIGILSVANSDSKNPNDNSRYDLIDGQQRITTLTLIGKAAKKYYEDKWSQFLITDRLELYGRKDDKDYIESGTNSLANIKLRETFDIAKIFFEELKDQNLCENFSKFIFENAVFFLANVPTDYSLKEKNQQFVRMNNRGKQLEPHEILKVKILNNRLVQNEESRRKYLNSWNEMAKCLTGTGSSSDDASNDKSLREILAPASQGKQISDVDEEKLYTPIVNIPEFLLIALARYRNKDISPDKSKLIATFESEISTNGLVPFDVDKFMDFFESQLKILEKYFVFYSKTGIYEIGDKNDPNDDTGEFSYPEGLKELTRSHLIAVQSYLYVSTEPHHWLIPAFNWCKKFEKQKIEANEFVKKLEEIDNNLIKSKKRSNLNRLPDLTELIYTNNINHYWFYRLDYELWKISQLVEATENIWTNFRTNAKKNKDVLSLLDKFKFRPCGSIEHIIPQVSQDLVENKPDHGFGNLALISSSRNSKFGNNNSEGKKGSIIESRYTESLKMLHFLYSDKFTVTQGEKMYQLLLDAVKASLPAPEPELEAGPISPNYVKPQPQA